MEKRERLSLSSRPDIENNEAHKAGSPAKPTGVRKKHVVPARSPPARPATNWFSFILGHDPEFLLFGRFGMFLEGKIERNGTRRAREQSERVGGRND